MITPPPVSVRLAPAINHEPLDPDLLDRKISDGIPPRVRAVPST